MENVKWRIPKRVFETMRKMIYWNQRKRLVKVFMNKYEEMQKDDELWSTAMAIQMGRGTLSLRLGGQL